jgi:putative DNA primase/helicase
MKALAQHLLKVGVKSVKIIDVTDKPSGWDIADAINDDKWDRAKLMEFMKERAQKVAPDISPEVVKEVQGDYLLNANGKPLPVAENIYRMLEKEWQGVFAYDELLGTQVVLTSKNPMKIPVGPVDDYYNTVRRWFNVQFGSKVNMDEVTATVQEFANLQTYNELHAWLNGLKWDGTKRIGHWLETYLRAEVNDDNRLYVRAIGKKYLIGSVARAFATLENPVKMDNVLVLEGGQGIGKTQTFKTLGGKWYRAGISNMKGKDAMQELRGAWIIEDAEGASYKDSGVEFSKAFMTREADSFRSTYGKDVKQVVRRCVFGFTTNEDDYLKDVENRRYWVIRMGEADIEALEADRDQLFAEAMYYYRKGVKWYIERDEVEIMAQATREQSMRREHDTWEDAVVAYLDGQTSVSAAEVMTGIGIDVKDQTQRDKKRVKMLMKTLGWEQKVTRVDGSIVRLYCKK